MFEKEAEEYVPNIKWHDFSSKDLREEMMLCYRKGAEFGYNKANEWHYVKDGDLPKEGISVLVMLENGQPDISGISTDKRWFCTDYYTGEDKVVAWKEIVLPELKENE